MKPSVLPNNLEQAAHTMWAQYAQAPSEEKFWENYQHLVRQAQQQKPALPTRKPLPTVNSAQLIGRFVLDAQQHRKNIKQMLVLLFTSLTILFLSDSSTSESVIVTDMGVYEFQSSHGGGMSFWFWVVVMIILIRYLKLTFKAHQLMIELTPQCLIRYQGNRETSKVVLKNIGVLKENSQHLVVFTEGVTSGLEHNFERQVVRIPKNLEQYPQIKYYLGQLRAQKKYV
ncbi:hypothetical protein [Microscilla marina]|uniref:Uncharacterized protein n=1 Tax=Microscilla marina ATCC 23134 TaxID=313606 RepID=A1ZUC9_MICM2|nr:hypothetical protein [Microscilla marina]EAY25948.1 hypothetical protein M23134_07093 [Microscilla marina ATCC 23134]